MWIVIIIIIIIMDVHYAHDSLVLLRNSLAMTKLLYLLRRADCSGDQLLEVFDSTLRAGLSKVLNVDLNDDQWLQASLPVGETLQDQSVRFAKSRWSSLSGLILPTNNSTSRKHG